MHSFPCIVHGCHASGVGCAGSGDWPGRSDRGLEPTRAACGYFCETDDQCQSRHCVDGFCCVTPGCSLPFVCYSGECDLVRPVAANCNADEQCDPPNCVEGACCDRDHCEPPKRCDVRRFEGSCVDPDSFGPQSFGKSCESQADCEPRFACNDGVCCELSDCGPFNRCDLPGSEGYCAILPKYACVTATQSEGDDGCAICDASGGSLRWLLLPGALLVFVSRRRRARGSTPG